MSVRRKDVADVADAASNFSLRGIVTAETIGIAKAVEPHKATTLSFNLGGGVSSGAAPQQPKRPSICSGIKPSTSNVFKLSAPSSANANSEVMRLTAYTDDLTRRLQDVSSKLQVAELQLTRTNQTLIAERHSAHRKINSMKTELAAAHDTESKLRAHIQNTAKGSSVLQSQESFLSTVRSAIAPEVQTEHQKSASEDVEKRIAELHRQQSALAAAKESALAQQQAQHAELEREVVKMREEHSSLCAQIEGMKASKESLAASIASSEQTQTAHETKISSLAHNVSSMEKRLAALQISVSTEEARLSEAKMQAEAASMLAEEAKKSKTASDFFESISSTPVQAVDSNRLKMSCLCDLTSCTRDSRLAI